MSDHRILERAFELARSGSCASTGDIKQRLKKEGFGQVEDHLSPPSISRQLRNLCVEARRAGPVADAQAD